MKVVLTDHCCDRYIARVKPWLDRVEAKAEIERLIDGREPVPSLEWAHTGGKDHTPFDAFLELSDGIALALRAAPEHLNAVSCLIRTGAGEEVIANRRRLKRIRKRRSQAQKARERFDRKRKPEPTSGSGWPD